MEKIYTKKSIGGVFNYTHALFEKQKHNAYARHSHNFYEIIFFIKGDATHIVEDKKYKLNPGDIIIARPGKYHYVRIDSESDYERHNVTFDHKALKIDTSALPEELDVVNVKDLTHLKDLFEKLSDYAKKFDSETFLTLAASLIQELIYNMSLTESKKRNENLSIINPILSRAIFYINENLLEIKDVSEIADAVFVTESYIYRLFKRELYKSPKKYITEKRLLCAEKLIRNGEKPTVTAVKCGFESYASFYRNYLSYFGTTPSEEFLKFRLTKRKK